MIAILWRDLVCYVLGHRVPWGQGWCARCHRVPGDELAP